MAFGYLPIHVLTEDKSVTGVEVRRAPGGAITVNVLGEQRVGLSRTLTRKSIDSTGDNTGFLRTFETTWQLMNSTMAFQSAPWDNYDGLLGEGDPATEAGGGGGGGA